MKRKIFLTLFILIYLTALSTAQVEVDGSFIADEKGFKGVLDKKSYLFYFQPESSGEFKLVHNLKRRYKKTDIGNVSSDFYDEAKVTIYDADFNELERNISNEMLYRDQAAELIHQGEDPQDHKNIFNAINYEFEAGKQYYIKMETLKEKDIGREFDIIIKSVEDNKWQPLYLIIIGVAFYLGIYLLGLLRRFIVWVFAQIFGWREEEEEIRYCAACGTKLDDDAQFCPECGNKLGQD